MLSLSLGAAPAVEVAADESGTKGADEEVEEVEEVEVVEEVEEEEEEEEDDADSEEGRTLGNASAPDSCAALL